MLNQLGIYKKAQYNLSRSPNLTSNSFALFIRKDKNIITKTRLVILKRVDENIPSELRNKLENISHNSTMP
jgi:hypothetical protein